MNFDNTPRKPTSAPRPARGSTPTLRTNFTLANLGFGQSDSGGSAIEQVILNAEEGAYANLGGAL